MTEIVLNLTPKGEVVSGWVEDILAAPDPKRYVMVLLVDDDWAEAVSGYLSMRHDGEVGQVLSCTLIEDYEDES